MTDLAIALKEGRTIFHRHPERDAIARAVRDFVLTPEDRRLLDLGVSTWADFASLLDQQFPDLQLAQMSDPASALRSFAKNYVVPGVVMGEAVVKEGIITGQYDLNTLRTRFEQLKEIEGDIAAARAEGAKGGELASLHAARARLLNDIDESMERFNLVPTKKQHTVTESYKVDMTGMLNNLTGAKKKPHGSAIDI